MPDISLSPRYVVLAVFIVSVLYVHLRGKVRLPFLRQLFNHSSILAPVNALLYLFSAVPPRPYLDPRGTPGNTSSRRSRTETIASRAAP